MPIIKHLSLPTFAASLLVLAGCTIQPTTNTNTVMNTSAANNNATATVVTNVNETVVYENTDTSDEVLRSPEDVADWLTYSSDIYDLTFQYPNNWSIKQEWLEQGKTGEKYNIYLQDKNANSILFFLTTPDFMADEGEGDPLYLSGSIIGDSEDEGIVQVLKDRGLPIYKTYVAQNKLDNTYYSVGTYGGTKLSLLTLFQNENKEFSFLTINSTLLADWNSIVSFTKVDEAIKKHESGNLTNQPTINEYIAIVGTVQY